MPKTISNYVSLLFIECFDNDVLIGAVFSVTLVLVHLSITVTPSRRTNWRVKRND